MEVTQRNDDDSRLEGLTPEDVLNVRSRLPAVRSDRWHPDNLAQTQNSRMRDALGHSPTFSQ